MTFKSFPYYWGAIATAKSIRAVLFIFLPGKKADKVTLDSCTGWVRHMGRFYESRKYAFVLNTELIKGDVEVLLLDHEKQTVLKLTPQVPSQTVYLDAEKNKYYLRWEFRSASGKCELHW